MGYLTHLIVAPESKAQDFADRGEQCSPGTQVLDLTGVDDSRLVDLWGILQKKEPDADVESATRAFQKDYWEGADELEGAFVMAFPRDFVEILGRIEESAIPSISESWSQRYKRLLIPVSQEEVLGHVRTLRSLAQEAARKNQRILMRMGE
jgi:hypothetical protein